MDRRWAYHRRGVVGFVDAAEVHARSMNPHPPETGKKDDESVRSAAAPGPGWLNLPAMRYPNGYVWFLFFSSLDIMLTWAILARHGSEVNPLADAVIKLWDLPGAIAFKFSLMLFVVIVCEVVGRHSDWRGRMLIWMAVLVSAVPVVYSLGLLVVHTLTMVNQG